MKTPRALLAIVGGRDKIKILLLPIIALFCSPALVYAAGAEASGGGHGASSIVFLFLAILLIAAKMGGFVEKFGQPVVLGEIAAGIFLSYLAFSGLGIIDDIRHSNVIMFFAELGAVILLFQIGLESNIAKMSKVGIRALCVAIIGVVAPFLLGTYIVGPLIFPDQDMITHLFIGASLVATSVGITAYVFRELKIIKTRACQVVLGAAVIDDVLGLLILAVVSALASGGSIDAMFVGLLTLKAFGFLTGAIIMGNLFAKPLSTAFAMISNGDGMKVAVSLAIAMLYAYAATLVGLAPIVGAFAAGLILDAVHFKNYKLPPIALELSRLRGFDKEEKIKIDQIIEKNSHAHVEDLISHIGLLLVPVFFIYTGLQIDFASLLNPQLYFSAIIISIIAIFGKAIAGVAAAGNFNEKLLVGIAMVPRGEVGLIFASVGKGLGVINDMVFSTIILVIIITTFIAPPIIKILTKKLSVEIVESPILIHGPRKSLGFVRARNNNMRKK